MMYGAQRVQINHNGSVCIYSGACRSTRDTNALSGAQISICILGPPTRAGPDVDRESLMRVLSMLEHGARTADNSDQTVAQRGGGAGETPAVDE
jgi:hypothetical protein